MDKENADYQGIENRIVKLNASKRLPIIIIVNPAVKLPEHKELIKKSIENLHDYILNVREIANHVEFAVVCGSDQKNAVQKLCEIKTQDAVKHYEYDFDEKSCISDVLKAAMYQWEGRKKILEETVPWVKHYSPIFVIISDGIVGTDGTDDMSRIENSVLAQKIKNIQKLVQENKLVIFSLFLGDCNEQNLLKSLTGLESDKHLIKFEDEFTLKEICKSILLYLFNDAHPVRYKKI